MTVGLHGEPSAMATYSGAISTSGLVWINKWSVAGLTHLVEGWVDFDPIEETDLEVALELQAVEIPPAEPGARPGQRLELRAWRPGREARPARAQIECYDDTYRAGTVCLSFAAVRRAERPIIFHSVEVEQIEPGPTFLRGDANADGSLDISDAAEILGHLFGGSPAPGCLDAADSNDSGAVDMTDAIHLFGHLFAGGAGPPAPGAVTCGADPTGDALDCESFPPCEEGSP
jgi:hypothetical protein